MFKELKLSLHDKKNSAQSAYYEQSFIVWAYSFIHPGLGRSLNFTIASPSDKAPSNVTCLGQILVYLFYNLVGRQLAFTLAHWAGKTEKLLTQHENLHRAL